LLEYIYISVVYDEKSVLYVYSSIIPFRDVNEAVSAWDQGQGQGHINEAKAEAEAVIFGLEAEARWNENEARAETKPKI